MRRLLKFLMSLPVIGVAVFCSVTVAAESVCGPDGLQASGSIYRICMPQPGQYNGKLIIWAHGFQGAGTPVEIPEDQLQVDNISLPEIANALGFGFATNSYSKTGLAIRQGMEDILDLVNIYKAEQGVPDTIYLTGASEGGIITTLLVEQHGDIFSGGIAACGPVGDFRYQINYFGDARLTFEYFFPGVIPGGPFDPPQTLVDNWRTFYRETVKPVVFAPANADALRQWVKVAKLPFDADNYLATVEESVSDVLRYAVVDLQDATETLGGFPYGNAGRIYRGSDHDLLMNLQLPVVHADPAAIAEIETYYTTSGMLDVPLITLHTTRDQQVPYRHENLYALKTIRSGAFLNKHLNLRIDRFGHCEFTVGEGVLALLLMLFYEAGLQ